MPASQPELPSSVARLARIIGHDAALALAGACKNRRLYVPRSIGSDHWLFRVIGADAARTLANAWGGEILYLAKCHQLKIKFRNEAIHRWHAEGKTVAELATLTSLTERMISIILAEKNPPMDGAAATAKVRA
jgi:hypothetical protein